MNDSRNTILAVILSGLVLIAWQYFYNMPAMEKRRAAEQAQAELVKPTQPAGTATTPQGGTAPAPSGDASSPAAVNQPAAAAQIVSRDAAIAASPRVKS